MKRNLAAENLSQAGKRTLLTASLVSAVGLIAAALALIRHLAVHGVFTPSEWGFVGSASSMEFLSSGAFDTFKVAVVASACCFALAVGLGWALASPSRVLERTASTLVILSGSVPLIVILYLLDYLFPWHGFAPDAFVLLTAGIVASNVGPVAESFAAGVRSVDRSQRSTGLSLGLRPLQVEMLVVAPQGLRRMLPALVTNVVAIVKDTSLGFLVPYGDLLDHAQQLNVTQGARAPLLATLSLAALFYVSVGLGGSRLAQRLEVRVDSGPVLRRRRSGFPVSWISVRTSR